IEARAETLDESLWPTIARAPEIAAASPVIETLVELGEPSQRLRVIGIDPMRAASVTPDLIPDAAGAGAGIELFADDTIFLSARALTLTGSAVGDTLRISAGPNAVELRIAGTVDQVAADVALAVM